MFLLYLKPMISLINSKIIHHHLVLIFYQSRQQRVAKTPLSSLLTTKDGYLFINQDYTLYPCMVHTNAYIIPI